MTCKEGEGIKGWEMRKKLDEGVRMRERERVQERVKE